MYSQLQWVIYGLIDPRDNLLRYVGWTSSTTRKRLISHMASCKREMTHKGSWLRLLRSLGITPRVITLEEGYGDNWKQAERKWIKDMRRLGFDLVNTAEGGEGSPGVKHSAETVEKRISKIRGIKRSEEFRQMLRDRPFSLETRERMAAWQKNRKLSEGTKRRISEARMRLIKSERGAHLRKAPVLSDESRQKAKESLKKYRTQNPQKHSAETKAKMSSTKKKYWETRLQDPNYKPRSGWHHTPESIAKIVATRRSIKLASS